MILSRIEPLFKELFRKNVQYRATGISIHHFLTEETHTHDLFGASARAQGDMAVFGALDSLNRRFGRGTVLLAASMKASSHKDPDRRKSHAKREYIHMPVGMEKKA